MGKLNKPKTLPSMQYTRDTRNFIAENFLIDLDAQMSLFDSINENTDSNALCDKFIYIFDST